MAHNWSTAYTDFPVQVIDRRVTPEMFHFIAMFDGSILLDGTEARWRRAATRSRRMSSQVKMAHEIVSTVAYSMGRGAAKGA